jgi:hypothetical protein
MTVTLKMAASMFAKTLEELQQMMCDAFWELVLRLSSGDLLLY